MADGTAPGGLRHDLRSPLTVVIGFAELLASERELTDEQRRDYAQRVLKAGLEIRALLDRSDWECSAGHPDRD